VCEEVMIGSRSALLRLCCAIVVVAALLTALPAAATAQATGRILFFEHGNGDEPSPGTFIMTGEGRLLQSFAETLGTTPSHADWNSDASLLAFVEGPFRYGNLLVERPDGTGRRTVIAGTRAAQPGFAEFSPAGDQIAYSAHDEDTSLDKLLVIPTAGGTPRPIAENLTRPGWSPDAQRIVAVGRGPDTSSGPGPEGLHLVNVAAGGSSLLVAQSFSPFDSVWPQWSPDGTLIAWAKGGAVWTVSPDGSGARAITPVLGARDVAWAPDGGAIAFGTFVSETSGAIYTVRPDGSGMRVLHRGTHLTLEDWVSGELSSLKPSRSAVVTRLVRGVVKIKRPRARNFFARLIPGADHKVPYRSQVDATRGRARITARSGRRTRTADAYGGRFTISRRGSRTLIRASSGQVRVRAKRKTAKLGRGESFVLRRPPR